jgi:hypothetical protein
MAAELAPRSSTVLGGRTVLRLCTVNPRTTREDVEATLARVEELARSGVGSRPGKATRRKGQRPATQRRTAWSSCSSRSVPASLARNHMSRSSSGHRP